MAGGKKRFDQVNDLRRRAEETERESEKRFRMLIEKAPDMFFAHDLAGTSFIQMNSPASNCDTRAKNC